MRKFRRFFLVLLFLLFFYLVKTQSVFAEGQPCFSCEGITWTREVSTLTGTPITLDNLPTELRENTCGASFVCYPILSSIAGYIPVVPFDACDIYSQPKWQCNSPQEVCDPRPSTPICVKKEILEKAGVSPFGIKIGIGKICATCEDPYVYISDFNMCIKQTLTESDEKKPTYNNSKCSPNGLICDEKTGTCQDQQRIGSNTIRPLSCNGGKGIDTAIGCIPTDPQALVNKLVGWLMPLAGGIAFILMLFGAFQVLTSTGDPEKLKKGKETLTSAIIGLLLIIFSVFILRIFGLPIMKISM